MQGRFRSVIAVLGGHGKTGRAVGAALAERGVQPRALGRADRALAAAVAGCSAAYVIAPNLHPDEPAYVGEALAALTEAGVPRVVYHSVASPYAPEMPHHLGKAMSEDLVRRSGLAWTVLQPGAYLQNLDLSGPVTVPYDVEAVFGFADLPTWPRWPPWCCSRTGTPGRRTSWPRGPPRWPSWPRRRASRRPGPTRGRTGGWARCSPTTTATGCRSARGPSTRCSGGRSPTHADPLRRRVDVCPWRDPVVRTSPESRRANAHPARGEQHTARQPAEPPPGAVAAEVSELSSVAVGAAAAGSTDSGAVTPGSTWSGRLGRLAGLTHAEAVEQLGQLLCRRSAGARRPGCPRSRGVASITWVAIHGAPFPSR